MDSQKIKILRNTQFGLIIWMAFFLIFGIPYDFRWNREHVWFSETAFLALGMTFFMVSRLMKLEKGLNLNKLSKMEIVLICMWIGIFIFHIWSDINTR